MVYTLKTLAERWDCSVDVVRRMVKSGKLHAFKVGNEYRISADEVARYESN